MRTSSLDLQSVVFPRSTKVFPHVSAARKLHTDNVLFPPCLSCNLWIFPQEDNTVTSVLASYAPDARKSETCFMLEP